MRKKSQCGSLAAYAAENFSGYVVYFIIDGIVMTRVGGLLPVGFPELPEERVRIWT